MRKYIVYVVAAASVLLSGCGKEQPQSPVAVKAPMMGWSSWNANRIDIDAELIRRTADLMVELGLRDAGYNYVNIDDGFYGGRDEEGNLLVNSKFPDGMRPVVDYIHSKGLKAGTYAELGHNTCAYYWDGDTVFGRGVGLYGHEQKDLDLYFNRWNFDFIKVDYCGGEKLGLDERRHYTLVSEIIDGIASESGRDLRLNVCRWQFPGTWVTSVADSWRVSQDIRPQFNSIRQIIELNLYHAAYASPGHYNDMDMLQLGNGMSPDEERTHFGMWAIMASPLLIGCNLDRVPDSTLELLSNREVIAVNQDPLCLQAQVVYRTANYMVLAKPIEKAGGRVRAVALYNFSDEPQHIGLWPAELQLSGKCRVRDLWQHRDMGVYEDHFEVEVPPHATAMLRIEGARSADKTVYEAEYAFLNRYPEKDQAHPVLLDRNTGMCVVRGIGGSEDNWAEFRDVYSARGGEYEMLVTYLCRDDRGLVVTANGIDTILYGLNSGEGGLSKMVRVPVRLNKGMNTIRLSNPAGPAPDIDKIELFRDAAIRRKLRGLYP